MSAPVGNPVVMLRRTGSRIEAFYADGSTAAWCDCATERGAKSRLTFHAKRLGFAVTGAVARIKGGAA